MLRRTILIAAFAVAAGAVFFFHPNRSADPRPRTMEADAKRQILQNDLIRTEQLCRMQCRLDLRQTAAEWDKATGRPDSALLRSLRREHPHMTLLLWRPAGDSSAGSIRVGSPPPGLKIDRYVGQAAKAAASGREYVSPRLDHDGSAYFVTAVPSKTKRGALIALVHQRILNEVAERQRKNLRLEAYPREGRYKVESAHPDSLRDTTVRDGEDNGNASHYHQNQVVVRFKNPPTEAELQKIRKELGARDVRKLGYTYVFESARKDAKTMMKYFKDKNILYAEPHYYYMTNEKADRRGDARFRAQGADSGAASADLTPNDLLYARYQWNLPLIDTTQGWRVSQGSKDVVVGVVDTGVDLNHPDLQGRLLTGYNVLDDTAKPMDDVGHGTHVAGVISALVDNYEGVAGMTWRNPVLPVKALDNTGAGSTYSVAQGIIWATDHGAKVINMSLGNYAESNFLHDAVKYAFDRDVVLIAATGNDNTDRPGYPAAYPEVLAVSAIDDQQKRAPFSNYGKYVDVVAPGVNIASTYPDNQYAALSGTSMACPHVTALAALIRSANPMLKNTEVMEILRKTSKDLGEPGKDDQFGYGRIDVNRALQAAEGLKYSLTYWPQWIKRGSGAS